jgi:hypothetical protein
MHGTLTRRELVERIATLTVMRSLAWIPTNAWPLEPLRVGVVTSSRDDVSREPYLRGIELGLDEAKHAASMFGSSIEAMMFTLESSRTQRVAALLGGATADECAQLAMVATERECLYVNVRCRSDSLRAACANNAFHVAPSDAMVRDALTQTKTPPGAWVEAWDGALDRFGADTLNQRFHSRFHEPMSSDAWAGWMSIKILWEAHLRVRSTDAKTLAAHLLRDTTQFDGHKGRALSFRATDHQLRQPVYVMVRDNDAARVVGEQPSPARADESTRESLDRIGVRREAPPCVRAP